MTSDQLRQKLQTIDAKDVRALDALAAQSVSDIREAPAAVVAVWKAEEGDAAAKAAMVAMQLEELSIAPLAVEAEAAATVSRRVDLLRAAVDGCIALRRQLLRSLDPAFTETKSTTLEEGSGLQTRVCDQTYLHARRAVPRGDGTASPPSEAVFLNKSIFERDGEIARWRKSLTWKNLIDESD